MKDLAHQRYDEACAHDRAGREDEAIPCYEEARSSSPRFGHLNGVELKGRANIVTLGISTDGIKTPLGL